MSWLSKLARKRERKRRCADFELSCAYDPEGVSRVPGEDWRFLTAQPFADDDALLANLGLEPEDCRSVDCYWHRGSEVVHLRVEARPHASATALGLYARRASGIHSMVELFALVAAPFVTRAGLVGAMRRFESLGVPSSEELSVRFVRLEAVPPRSCKPMQTSFPGGAEPASAGV